MDIHPSILISLPTSPRIILHCPKCKTLEYTYACWLLQSYLHMISSYFDSFSQLYLYKLRTEAYTILYIYHQSTHWLTHCFVRVILLKTWQRRENHTLAKLLQGFREQVTWPTLLADNFLVEYFANNKLKIINLSKHWSLCEPGENLLATT